MCVGVGLCVRACVGLVSIQRHRSAESLSPLPRLASLSQGINGTIFCYGQTGAGKTFTMAGDLRNYQHRGIIPQVRAGHIHTRRTASSYTLPMLF